MTSGARQVLVRHRSTLVCFLQDAFGLGHLSKTAIRKQILQTGLCRVNSRVEQIASLILQPKDVVELLPCHATPTSTPVSLQSGPLEDAWATLYEDAEIRVVNKPAPWSCTPDACRRLSFGHEENPHQLVHRLDKTTTGALMLAKSSEARGLWCERFRRRQIYKEYLAIVDGVPLRSSGTQETLLRRCVGLENGQVKWQTAPVSTSVRGGLSAVTRWRVLGTGQNSALIACQPITGRTHQIRVHMAGMGHPLLVDALYSRTFRAELSAHRPLLHAFRIKSSGMFAQAPVPRDFSEALHALGIDYDATLLRPPSTEVQMGAPTDRLLE